MKILDRIAANDNRYGITYSQRAKKIGAYFKTEFETLRKLKEGDTYFHNIVLNDYRYKGDALFKKVRNDLKVHQETYHTILNSVGKKDRIVHLSKGDGQLDFLLSLDAVDRKIITYIEDEKAGAIIKNSFITNNNSKIKCVNRVEDALTYSVNTIIINLDSMNEKQVTSFINNGVNQIILIKESRNLPIGHILDLGFKSSFQNKSILILTKQ